MPFENKVLEVALQCDGPGYWERVKKTIENINRVDVGKLDIDAAAIDAVEANKLTAEILIRGKCLKNVDESGNCPGTGELCPFVQRKKEPIDTEELEDRILASEDPYGPNFDPDGD